MKKFILLGAAAMMTLGFTACDGSSKTPVTTGDSISYFLGQGQGMMLNESVKNMPELDIDKDAFMEGFKVAIKADTTQKGYQEGLQMGLQMASQIKQWEDAGIDIDRDMLIAQLAKTFTADSVDAKQKQTVDSIWRPLMDKAYTALMNKRAMDQEKAAREAEEKAQVNIEAGKAFIDSLKAADKDVKVSESGLAYKVITMGNGAVAKEADKVSVVYTGKLIDGSEFDSSKGEAVKFSPRQVVAGFGEALTTFPIGTKVILYIPENLGYGKRASGKIAPGSTLVFDLEIKDIEVKKEAKK